MSKTIHATVHGRATLQTRPKVRGKFGNCASALRSFSLRILNIEKCFTGFTRLGRIYMSILKNHVNLVTSCCFERGTPKKVDCLKLTFASASSPAKKSVSQRH